MAEDRPILKATHGSTDKPLRIGDIEIPCWVLENGTRVVSQRGLNKSLGVSVGGPKGHAVKGTGGQAAQALARVSPGNATLATIVEQLSKPFKFIEGGRRVNGYPATILVDICEAVLQVRDDGELPEKNQALARRCEILMRGFAKVGIIALIDEVTGYQAQRDKDELHRILEAYISKELLAWTKRFPDEFYIELFRLRGWNYRPLSVKRPHYVGTLTNDIVYQKLPPGVIEELQRVNPSTHGRRKHKHHQYLTPEVGNAHLEKHLHAVITLMRAAKNWRSFVVMLERAFPARIGQQELDLGDVEDETEEGAE